MKIRSEYGVLSNVINTITEKENIDYIIMGTKGASGIKKMLVGSNTADVVKTVKSPIIAIPKKTAFLPPVKIAFATDHKQLKNETLLSPLAELVKQFHSKLYIVYVHPKEKIFQLANANGSIQLHKIDKKIQTNYYNIENKNVVEGIEQFVKNYRIDMLALVSKEHRFFENIFRTSVSQEISMLTDIPLLILHEN